MPASLSDLGVKPQQIAPIDGSISKTVQQNMAKQAEQQSVLVSSVGGKRRKYKGGSTVNAPPLKIGYSDPSGATQNNADAINKLAIDTQQAAVFDKASSQAQTQALAVQQQKALSGGKRRRRKYTNKRKSKKTYRNKKYSRKYRR
jgi:hypothetical protein